MAAIAGMRKNYSEMPVGVGEPVFDKLSANLGKAILSIGAVKGFEIGDGFAAAASAGSENNDDFYNDNGTVKKENESCRWCAWWNERWFSNYISCSI